MKFETLSDAVITTNTAAAFVEPEQHYLTQVYTQISDTYVVDCKDFYDP
jgi:hypothetical protein